jgi:uncharacterized lipoprotein YddW (UPF0748 family)
MPSSLLSNILASTTRSKHCVVARLITTLFLCALSFSSSAFEDKLVANNEVSPRITRYLSSSNPIEMRESKVAINNQNGTIIFWINPHSDAGPSHTFFSTSWDSTNANTSYMVISDGWWENSVPKSIYFVLDNSQLAFCNANNVNLRKDHWYQLALTWGTEHGTSYCRIYVNGEIRTEKKISTLNPHSSNTSALFSDKYTDNPNNRTLGGLTSNWIFFPNALNHQQIENAFRDSASAHQPIETSPGNPALIAKAVTDTSTETVALFDEDIFWALSKTNTDAALALLERGGFNLYVPCVWHGNGAYFMSSTKIYADAVRTRIANDDDPLTYLLNEAHKRGISVYPWFTMVLNESTHLSKYATADLNGAFDIHNEAFRTFISDLVIDVIKRYPVDGINLDYIRSMGICETTACQEDFSKHYHQNLLTSTPLSRAIKHTPIDIGSNSISQWNGAAITSVLTKISSVAKSKEPQIKVTVDSVPLSPDFLLEGHDSIAWLNSGLIDAVFSMEYGTEPNINGIEQAKGKLKQPQNLIPLFSVYDQIGGQAVPRSNDRINQYFRIMRTKWPDSGIAFYHRKQITADHLNAIRSNTSPVQDRNIR